MDAIFLGSFIFGALFTVVSFALGAAGEGFGHLNIGQLGQGTHGGHNLGHSDSHGEGLPLLNFSSLLAAVTWFGAAGYLLSRYTDLPLGLVLAGGIGAAAVGGLIIAFFLAKVMAGERVMQPEDYRLEGTTGKVTVTIPEGGTGEVLFSKAGVRRGEAARSLTGAAILRDTEVVIIEYERGVALVQPWEEMLAEYGPRGLQGMPGEAERPAR